MADTFGQTWRRILLHCPFVPVPLAQAWVRDRYRTLLDAAGVWGGQTAESQFIIPDAFTAGTVSLTNSSATVLGVGTGWTSVLEGRQLFLGGSAPYYTITSVVDPTTITLERPFGGVTTGAGTAYQIAQAYVTPPSDFLYFKSIKDPQNNWRLRFNVSQEWLDKRDARRTTTGNAWLFADYRQSTGGIPRYEVWPRVVSQKLYPFLYVKRPADLTNDGDLPMFPVRGDELVQGALAELARWPGTETRRNPAFNLDLARAYEKEFTDIVSSLHRVDQETYLSSYVGPSESWDNLPEAPIDSAFWQNHDF